MKNALGLMQCEMDRYIQMLRDITNSVPVMCTPSAASRSTPATLVNYLFEQRVANPTSLYLGVK